MQNKLNISDDKSINAKHDIYQNIKLPYQSLDKNGILIDINDTWCNAFGYSRDEVVNKPFINLLTEESSDLFSNNFGLLNLDGSANAEFDIITKDGKICHVVADAIVDYEKDKTILRTHCFLIDLTMHHTAEMELHRLAARNSAILGILPDIIMEIDSNGLFTWSNNNGIIFFGSNIIGKHIDSFVIQDKGSFFLQIQELNNIETWFTHNDGRKCLMSCSINILNDTHIGITGMIFSAKDISKEHYKQQKLNHINAMLLGIRNVNRLINKESSPKKLLEGVCKALVNKMGYSASWGALFKGENTPYFTVNIGFNESSFSQLKQILDEGILPECVQYDLEHNSLYETHLVEQLTSCSTCPMRDGLKEKTLYCNNLTIPIYLKNKLFANIAVLMPREFSNDKDMTTLFHEVALDLSNAFEKIQSEKELKHLKEEQLQLGKIESLGVMAGGIAHDFNNLLTTILGFISLTKSDPKLTKKSYNYLEHAENASERARDLTQRLSNFSKCDTLIITKIDIKSIIKEAVHFIIRNESIKVNIYFDKNLDYIAGDESQLNQVFNNILLNASEALTKKDGTIDIKASNESFFIPNSEDNNSKYVAITITDSGQGIEESIINKIFDPYFSTKSRGTGLGLSSVYSIIKNHKGKIYATSEINKSTTFTIYLPIFSKSK